LNNPRRNVRWIFTTDQINQKKRKKAGPGRQWPGITSADARQERRKLKVDRREEQGEYRSIMCRKGMAEQVGENRTSARKPFKNKKHREGRRTSEGEKHPVSAIASKPNQKRRGHVGNDTSALKETKTPNPLQVQRNKKEGVRMYNQQDSE